MGLTAVAVGVAVARRDGLSKRDERRVCALRRKARRNRLSRPVLGLGSGGGGMTGGAGCCSGAAVAAERCVARRDEASSSAESERTTLGEDDMSGDEDTRESRTRRAVIDM